MSRQTVEKVRFYPSHWEGVKQSLTNGIARRVKVVIAAGTTELRRRVTEGGFAD